MEPHLHVALLVHRDEILRDGEVSNPSIQQPKPQQGCLENIEILREGYILDVCQPQCHPFHQHPNPKQRGAQLSSSLMEKILHLYEPLLPPPKRIPLQVLHEFLLACAGNSELIQHLTSHVIAHLPIGTMNRIAVRGSLRV